MLNEGQNQRMNEGEKDEYGQQGWSIGDNPKVTVCS